MAGKLLFRRRINPLFLFVGVFVFAFFLLNASDFITNSISSKTKSIYVSSIVAFIFGLAFRILMKKKHQNKYRQEPCASNINDRKHWSIIKTLSFLYIAALFIYFLSGVITYGFASFFQYILILYPDEVVKQLGSIGTLVLYLKMIGMFLSPYALSYILFYKTKQVRLWILIVFTLVGSISYTRNILFYTILLDVFVFIYYARNKASNFKFAKSFKMITISLGLGYFFLYTQSLFNKVLKVSGSLLGIPITSGLVTIIAYFCGPLVSTSTYLESSPEIPMLGFTLRNLYNLLDVFGTNFNTLIYSGLDFIYIPFKFNTATMQYYNFSEGGHFWLILFYFMLGMWSASIWIQYYKKKDALSLVMLSFTSVLLVTSIRSYILTRLDVLVFLVIYFILSVSYNKKIRFVLSSNRK